MVEPNENEKSLNLESCTSDELERKPVCESASDDAIENLECLAQGPHTSRHSKSPRRELLRNNFDAVE
jgi:hypothetical protein